MPKNFLPPPGRRRLEPILDDLVKASVTSGKEIHPPGQHVYEKRFHGDLVYAGCESRARATEIKNALHRAAKHCGVSMNCDIVKQPDGKTYNVNFRAICKECSRHYMTETYGTDISKWPYNPYQKKGE
jgi:hypothetical protein